MHPSLFVLLVLTVSGHSAAWGAESISGSTPHRRPERAPTVRQSELSPAQLGARLHGVTDPLPNNVVEAAAAGPWFMPLAHPGMLPPYDLRGWHKPAAGSRPASQ